HTGNWPHQPVDFTGQRVGIIGTGSSGIQTIPFIAAQAKELTVFQRTPNFSIPAWNRPLPEADQQAWKADYAAHRVKAKQTRSGILYDYSQRAAFTVSAGERQEEYERRWLRGGSNFTHAFNDIYSDRPANDTAAEFVREKIRTIVKNPAKAQLLAPTDHAIGTKRICVDTDYYDTYNQEHVHLVDLKASPIEEIVAGGIRTTTATFELDSIIFATGYDAVTGSLDRIDIRGIGGQPLKTKWSEGPRTYLGLMCAGFPNMFLITGPQSPSILKRGDGDRSMWTGLRAAWAICKPQKSPSPKRNCKPKTTGLTMSARSRPKRCLPAPTPGTPAPTSPASRASSCPISAGWATTPSFAMT
ncbi:flavin-containing monooxygenase, partial [Roseateles sp. GG27B]